MQCRDRHKSFVFNIRDVCFIMKMKNVKKIDMNKKLYEQIKALLADKLDEKEQKELFHHREFEEKKCTCNGIWIDKKNLTMK